MVDLNLAMRTGRKRGRRRRMAMTAGSVVGVVAVIVAAPATIHVMHGTEPAGVVVAASPKTSAGIRPTTAAPSTPAPTPRKNDTAMPVGAEATTISDSGLIIGGQDVDENNVITAVMWTCH